MLLDELQHQAALARWVLGRVHEHAPRRPAADSVPDLLGGGVPDGFVTIVLHNISVFNAGAAPVRLTRVRIDAMSNGTVNATSRQPSPSSPGSCTSSRTRSGANASTWRSASRPASWGAADRWYGSTVVSSSFMMLGGPTANMYRLACKSPEIEAACRAVFRDEEPTADAIDKVVNRVVDEKVRQAMDSAWRRTEPSATPLLVQMRDQVAEAGSSVQVLRDRLELRREARLAADAAQRRGEGSRHKEFSVRPRGKSRDIPRRRPGRRPRESRRQPGQRTGTFRDRRW